MPQYIYTVRDLMAPPVVQVDPSHVCRLEGGGKHHHFFAGQARARIIRNTTVPLPLCWNKHENNRMTAIRTVL
jgi:hypothetical protein